MIAALTKISGKPPVTVWQTDTEIPDVDLIVHSRRLLLWRLSALRRDRRAHAGHARGRREGRRQGVTVLGVCNGFQILVEAGLLPGALMRNASLKFVCREVKLQVAQRQHRLHPRL